MKTIYMEQLHIEATNDTPKVYFNAETGILDIKERSLPENAIDFYQPIFEWIYNYVDQPKNVTTFNFKLEYFSTSSAKQITKIFFLLEKLSDNNEVIVNWYYKKEDLDMYSSGLKYSKLTNLKFNLLEY